MRWLQQWTPGLNDLAARAGVDVEQWPQKISAIAIRASQYVGSLALTAGQNVAGFVVKFAIMLYLLFFVLRDGDEMLEKLIVALPTRLPFMVTTRVSRPNGEVFLTLYIAVLLDCPVT